MKAGIRILLVTAAATALGFWISVFKPESLALALERSITSCTRQSSAQKECLKKEAERVVKQYEVKDVLSALDTLETHQSVFSVCHEFAHYVGRQAYQTRQNVQKTIMQGAHVCYGGYYHGVMEQFLATVRPNIGAVVHDEIDMLFSKSCGLKEQYNNQILYTECIHGFGHGTMLLAHGNLPQALVLCDALPDEFAQSQCYGGVFMENATSTTSLGHVSEWVKPDDPMYPCNELNSRYKHSCYMYQSTYVAKNAESREGKVDWTQVSRFCAEVPGEYQAGCYFVIGTNLPSTGGTTDDYWEICNEFHSVAVPLCVRGVVASLTGWYLPDTHRVISFCSSVEETQKEPCYSQMGSSIKVFTTDVVKQKELCSTITKQSALDWCEKGTYE